MLSLKPEISNHAKDLVVKMCGQGDTLWDPPRPPVGTPQPHHEMVSVLCGFFCLFLVGLLFFSVFLVCVFLFGRKLEG